MLQKELAKRLKARYDTKMDGNGWLEVSTDGIPLCRIKYNGQFLSNADQNLSDEYRSKIADIQDEISTVREYVGLYEHAPQMKADGVSDYRQLAAFGDTVLAATYSEKNGFMFCTWKQNADGDSVFWGDYSPNYEYDEHSIARHAHKRGTGSESTYKGNAESCDPRYSFHWTGTDNTLYLFEAPIDMLSFISLHKENWRSHSYAAACCVGDQVLFQMLKANPNIDTVCLCMDNDTAGQAANKRISDKLFIQGIKHEILVPEFKDWNEDLLCDEQEETECQTLQL